MLITALRKRSDTAGQRTPVGGEVHQRPGTPAQRPRGAGSLIAFEAQAGLSCRARRAEAYAVGMREPRRFVEVARLLPGHLLVKRLIGTRVSNRIMFKENQSLQVDFLYADFGGELYECRQFSDRLLQSCEPGRDTRQLFALAFLQIAK